MQRIRAKFNQARTEWDDRYLPEAFTPFRKDVPSRLETFSVSTEQVLECIFMMVAVGFVTLSVIFVL